MLDFWNIIDHFVINDIFALRRENQSHFDPFFWRVSPVSTLIPQRLDFSHFFLANAAEPLSDGRQSPKCGEN